MSWVNLDDVYVNKTGDSIAGNLSVGGTLTINNAKGNGGTYNVANEITTLRDSVSPKYTSKTVTASGWAGTITTTLLSSNTLGVYAYIYTENLAGAPWQNAVQPSVNPAGSDIWYINLGQACVSVGANMRKFENVCNLQTYDTSYYAKYSGALNPTFWIGANNMYVQIGANSMWTRSPAVLRISTALKI